MREPAILADEVRMGGRHPTVTARGEAKPAEAKPAEANVAGCRAAAVGERVAKEAAPPARAAAGWLAGPTSGPR